VGKQVNGVLYYLFIFLFPVDPLIPAVVEIPDNFSLNPNYVSYISSKNMTKWQCITLYEEELKTWFQTKLLPALIPRNSALRETVLQKLLPEYMKAVLDLRDYSVAGIDAYCQARIKISILEAPKLSSIKLSSQQAFERPYNDISGARAHAFLTLSEYARKWDRNSWYYPGTAIVQSSGSGKSKMVLSMTELDVYVFYCSFMSSTSSRVPARSAFAHYFLGNFPGSESELLLRFLSFFLAASVLKRGKTPSGFAELQKAPDFHENLIKLMDKIKADYVIH